MRLGTISRIETAVLFARNVLNVYAVLATRVHITHNTIIYVSRVYAVFPRLISIISILKTIYYY